MAWYDYTPQGFIAKKLRSGLERGNNEFRDVDPNGDVGYAAYKAHNFANQGQVNYGRSDRNLGGLSAALGAQMQGRNLVSTEQLRQGLQQNQAAQQSMAAGASPANQAMAARTAMMNSARLGAGMSGQAALAAMQERDLAQKLFAQNEQARMTGGMNVGLQSRQSEMQGLQGIENARTGRYGALAGAPTATEGLLGAAMGGAGIAMMSDRRLKQDIAGADDDATQFLRALKAYKYKYKDEKHGKGEQLGIMAQDLEKTRLGRQAVIETSEGKAVHGAKLAGALAAAAASLDKRLSKVEARG